MLTALRYDGLDDNGKLSEVEILRLERVKADAHRREWGTPAQNRLEYARWLHAHGRITDWPES